MRYFADKYDKLSMETGTDLAVAREKRTGLFEFFFGE